MQSYWMQMTDTRHRAGAARRAGARSRARGSCWCACTRPRSTAASSCSATACTASPAAGRRSAAKARAKSSPSAPSVTGFKPGDRVMGRCAGAFSEYALMEAAEAMAVPPNLSWEEAASIPLTFLVVVRHAGAAGPAEGRRMAADQRRLVGRRRGLAAARQGAGRAGHRHFGLGRQAGSAASRSASTSPCARARADFAPAVMEATGQHGADLVVNTVGGSVFAENMRALAFEGRLATVGYVDGVLHADIDLEALHAKRLTLFGVSNKLRTQGAARGRRAALRRRGAAAHRGRPHQAADRPGVRLRAAARKPRRAWKPARTSARSCCACRPQPDRQTQGDKTMKSTNLRPGAGAVRLRRRRAARSRRAYPSKPIRLVDRLRARRRGRLSWPAR